MEAKGLHPSKVCKSVLICWLVLDGKAFNLMGVCPKLTTFVYFVLVDIFQGHFLADDD